MVAAFLLFGLRNAGTPLLIASTPVSAVQPEENARSSRNISASPANVPVDLDRVAGGLGVQVVAERRA